MTADTTPTTLYRLYDEGGDLLYVGISTRPLQRVREHSKGQVWWTEVASQTFQHYPTRTEAAAAELHAIRTENPKHNVVGAKARTAGQIQEQRLWERLCKLRPQGADLVTLASIIGRTDHSPTFCANAYWYGYDLWDRADPEHPTRIPQIGLRDRLNVTVGTPSNTKSDTCHQGTSTSSPGSEAHTASSTTGPTTPCPTAGTSSTRTGRATPTRGG